MRDMKNAKGVVKRAVIVLEEAHDEITSIANQTYRLTWSCPGGISSDTLAGVSDRLREVQKKVASASARLLPFVIDQDGDLIETSEENNGNTE